MMMENQFKALIGAFSNSFLLCFPLQIELLSKTFVKMIAYLPSYFDPSHQPSFFDNLIYCIVGVGENFRCSIYRPLPFEAVAEGEKVWISRTWEEVRLFSREAQELIEVNLGGE